MLADYMNALKKFESKILRPILVVTDDVNIVKEISKVDRNGHEFLKPEPAPRRILDKVD